MNLDDWYAIRSFSSDNPNGNSNSHGLMEWIRSRPWFTGFILQTNKIIYFIVLNNWSAPTGTGRILPWRHSARAFWWQDYKNMYIFTQWTSWITVSLLNNGQCERNLMVELSLRVQSVCEKGIVFLKSIKSKFVNSQLYRCLHTCGPVFVFELETWKNTCFVHICKRYHT